MKSVQHITTDDSDKIKCLIKNLITQKQNSKQLIKDCLYQLNKSNQISLFASDSTSVKLLVNQLCTSVQPTDADLVKPTSEYLTSLMKQGVTFQDQTLLMCKRWLLETLEFSEADSQIAVLIALQTFFSTCAYSLYFQDLRKLIGENSLLCRFLYNSDHQSNELTFYALCCLEALLINTERKQITASTDFLSNVKEIVMKILSSLPTENNERHFNRKIFTCMRILRIITSEKVIVSSINNIGEILGVIQVFLFCGIEDYPLIIPQQLRPAIMNMPINTCAISKTKSTKNSKTRFKKPLPSTLVTDVKNQSTPNPKFMPKFPSDSETSDTESSCNTIQMESKIRLETAQLLYNIVLNYSSRELFGYWTQIVASGSQTNARVLTRLILKDSSYKVRQRSWIIMSELLRGSRNILQHAEDIEHSSFITVFALLSSVIKELHYTVSLSLHVESNVAVLIHALKCASALVESTPYHRLKPELALELIKNCRVLTIHKDPAVRVAALSVFEDLTLSEPIIPEIINSFKLPLYFDDSSTLSLKNYAAYHNNDKNEIHFKASSSHDNVDVNCEGDIKTSWILKICLENISDEASSIPVRLQSLKLLSALSNNVGKLIFPHLKTIAEKLIVAAKNTVPQIILHIFRVIDVITGRLESNKEVDEIILFWNIICGPVINGLQHSEAILKEVACNCLGNIGSNVFIQLKREESLLIITLLFGATRDQQSAVRAASLRTLGLLVSLPALEESIGFLMDLADITCLSLQDENLGVRIKSAWALASLCDCFIRIEKNAELESLQINILLPKIYETSVKAAKDSDKVKCNITRVIGSILYLSFNCQALRDTSEGLESLIECATLSNDQKVKWNACRALGLVMSRQPDSILSNSWQLCLTLSHLAVQTQITDLLPLWTEIGDHLEDFTVHMKQFQNRILPENADDIINAQITFSKYKQECSTIKEREIANTLEKLFMCNAL
ncbi:HEAT repeat-containing protein 6 isoform X2 [Leptopilina heterotoma]|uniref:HEAT repeat-containing protein 6 isoform X2 n=1 Tax=Leptopilina heterotoma TaxID=63436 RepID=UPI001CA973D4|nr:HEAT repeat-containing protein 6 isoform X2 [Leptopilina heterotoma]